MEGTEPYAPGSMTCYFFKALAHFMGCFVGKSQGKDLGGIYGLVLKQVSNAIGEYLGLASSSSGNDHTST